MESETVHPPLTRRPTLACSWDAACGALAQSLHLTRSGLGARDADWEELLAPPATGQDLVILRRNANSQDENPCFLYLRCDPPGGEEIVSIGILSSARNMEVYSGDEYCGTSRGKNVCNVLDNSEHEKIILYKKYLKLESSTHACKIKLLSFGEKQCVFISKVVVHMRPVLANSSAGCPALGSRIDLERVQTIMESLGSKLSPGAQQLMNMVRFQQQIVVSTDRQFSFVLFTGLLPVPETVPNTEQISELYSHWRAASVSLGKHWIQAHGRTAVIFYFRSLQQVILHAFPFQNWIDIWKHD
ncbi:ATPase PAAT-like isoform X2 [Kogia breviceps]|uniref:ATPase PAAT-like isoform X2 n=1 Tax=Kogia breviceps TaxID=27615 RepID=UPI0034D23A41